MDFSYKKIMKLAHYHNSEKLILRKLLSVFKKNGAKNLLDVGCGIGEYVNLFKTSGLDFDGVVLTKMDGDSRAIRRSVMDPSSALMDN